MPRWEEFCSLCDVEGCRLAFGLNALSGRKQVGPTDWEGPWDPTNSAAFINFTAQMHGGCPLLAWELGNEVAGPGGVTAHLPAKQYAQDAAILQRVIKLAYANSPRSLPLVAAADTFFDPSWYATFLKAEGAQAVDVVTRHTYYLGAGVNPNLTNVILDPSFQTGQQAECAEAAGVVSECAPGAELWVGESGGAYNSGQHGATDTFMSAFWYMDQLGLTAANHHSRHCRQSLVGGSYGLRPSW
eukprot:TRINITY_DN6392_c0_g1_i13.p1 TRINITY_DN6392_c0_g1~~TRINITY_DN6392_c0_g1_i13.p1  ORF type:complete len:243 (+),score=27.65 TRINITY_DN6392_c0_g1_i13:748-1476(+)